MFRSYDYSRHYLFLEILQVASEIVLVCIVSSKEIGREYNPRLDKQNIVHSSV